MVERTAMAESSESLDAQPSGFSKLCEIVATLRAPGGCPWDREQTHESLLPAVIEEAYEVAGAVRANDSANFREELGDLFLLVVMHAEIAREAGRFDIDSVLEAVTEKLIRRHPHVFGTSDARDSGAVLKQWESIKRAEKTGKHYLDDLPSAIRVVSMIRESKAHVARSKRRWAICCSPSSILRGNARSMRKTRCKPLQ